MRINTQAVSIVLIRALGVYLFAAWLIEFSTILSSATFWQVFELGKAFSILGLVLIPLAVGIALWFLAPRIARRVYEDSSEGNLPEERAIVSAGTFLLGVYWAMTSLSWILSQYSTEETLSYVGIIIFGISVFLIVGNNFIARVYMKSRRDGDDT
jgi:hypothetical protein